MGRPGSAVNALLPAAETIAKRLIARRETVTSRTRSDALPDVPTIGEFVPGYEASVWNGLVAPKNTPTEIIDKLYKEIDAALADPKIIARFAAVGSVPKSMTPADFGKFIVEDTEKWGASPWRCHRSRPNPLSRLRS
jgi:tripartite-type tricarboxylate transporter receptor subunit TctC